jgi:hypothetical protein
MLIQKDSSCCKNPTEQRFVLQDACSEGMASMHELLKRTPFPIARQTAKGSIPTKQTSSSMVQVGADDRFGTAH